MKHYDTHVIIDEFSNAMRAAGITPGDRDADKIDADGKLVRFHIAGDKRGTRNGWAVLFGDNIPAGEFGSWKTGETHTWCAEKPETITPEETRAIQRRMEEARAERERQQREREGEAAKAANLLWLDSQPADDSHPYLVRKGIRAHGLRIGAWPVRNRDGEVFRHIQNTLLIPIMSMQGKIVSLQAIFPGTDPAFGRDKDFLVGGRKRGCFFTIGRPSPGKPVAFCEGYATGESIHQATGWCVVICWDAFNIPNVVEEWRTAIPDGSFVICADNDQWTKQPVDNPGVTYAKRAAAGSAARVVVPDFGPLDEDDGRPTDFNDLHMREGIEAVQSAVLPPLPAAPQAAPPAPNAPGSGMGSYYVPGNLSDFDTYTPFADINGKGKPLPTARNLAELFRRTGIVARYNVIKKDLEILVPGLTTSIDNGKEVALSEVMDCLHRVGMPTGNFEGSLCAVAEANQYNPVATWVDSKPWDGVSRLQSFFNTVTEKEPQHLPDGRSLKEVLMRKWLISAIAAVYEPDGVVARGVLTFMSAQNLGKTRWAKQLAPRDMGVIADGEVLNPADKDSVKRVISKWIVELGEVDATFRRADIAALKGFISRDSDEIRRPYARTESRYARRTIFFASVNDERFLHDSTGNTRWWTIHAIALGEPAQLDMQQVWAEVASLYRAGETWHLSPTELDALNSHNASHEQLSPVAEMIDRNFDWSAPTHLWTHNYRATEIAMAAGIERPGRKEVNEAAAYVTKRYGVTTCQVGKERAKVWRMPPRTMEGPF
ncbi:TPA: VapE domain-containing protein [Stenotrophomonas maltophilia]